MRILHLLSSPAFSGPAENILLLARAQRALGHAVTVAVDRTRSPTSEEPAAPAFAAAGLLDERIPNLSVKSGPLALLEDARAIRSLEVDVLHAHFSHDHLLCRFTRPSGTRLVRSIHAPRSLSRSTPRADAFTVPFEGLRAAMPGRGMVLPALLDERFSPGPGRAAVDARPVIGMVSTFQASRRHDVAVQAFAKVLAEQPGARLVLVGDGATVPETKRAVEAAGLSKSVTFTGYLKGEAFLAALRSFDQVWILGLGNDFSARAAAQASACGAWVLGVNEGALPEEADAIVTATPEEIARAARAPAKRQRTRKSSEEVARDVLALYEAAR